MATSELLEYEFMCLYLFLNNSTFFQNILFFFTINKLVNLLELNYFRTLIHKRCLKLKYRSKRKYTRNILVD